MGEKFDPSGIRTRDRLVRRQPLYNRYSDANHYTIGSLVISSLDLLVTQVKLFLETTGRQVSSVNVHFDRLADIHMYTLSDETHPDSMADMHTWVRTYKDYSILTCLSPVFSGLRHRLR